MDAEGGAVQLHTAGPGMPGGSAGGLAGSLWLAAGSMAVPVRPELPAASCR